MPAGKGIVIQRSQSVLIDVVRKLQLQLFPAEVESEARAQKSPNGEGGEG